MTTTNPSDFFKGPRKGEFGSDSDDDSDKGDDKKIRNNSITLKKRSKIISHFLDSPTSEKSETSDDSMEFNSAFSSSSNKITINNDNHNNNYNNKAHSISTGNISNFGYNPPRRRNGMLFMDDKKI